jgi:hypothetical protein
VERTTEADARAFAFALERALFDHGFVPTVVSNITAAVACAEAGLIPIVLSGGSAEERERLHAALRASGHGVLETAEDDVERAISEVHRSIDRPRPQSS